MPKNIIEICRDADEHVWHLASNYDHTSTEARAACTILANKFNDYVEYRNAGNLVIRLIRKKDKYKYIDK